MTQGPLAGAAIACFSSQVIAGPAFSRGGQFPDFRRKRARTLRHEASTLVVRKICYLSSSLLRLVCRGHNMTPNLGLSEEPRNLVACWCACVRVRNLPDMGYRQMPKNGAPANRANEG